MTKGRLLAPFKNMEMLDKPFIKRLKSGYYLSITIIALIIANFYKYRSKGELNTTHDDFAVDLLRSRYEMVHGLKLEGHFSRTLGGTHPGPIYDWLLVFGNFLSSHFNIQAIVATFYLLTLFNIIIIALCVRVIWFTHGIVAAKVFLLLLLLWESIDFLGGTSFGQAGELNFLNGGKLGSPLWPPYISPYLFLFFLVSLHGYFKNKEKTLIYLLPSMILASLMYLPFLYLLLPLYLVVVINLFLKKEISLRSKSLILSLILLLPILYRLLNEGIRFLKPNQLTLDQMKRYFGDNSGWHPSKGSFVLEKLYGLPLWGVILFNLSLLTLAYLSRGKEYKGLPWLKITEYKLITLITITGLLEIYLLYPSQIGIYQFNWVVFYSIFALAIMIAKFLDKSSSKKIGFVTTILVVITLSLSLFSNNLLKLEPSRAVMSNEKTLKVEKKLIAYLSEKGVKSISLTVNSEENYNLSSSLYWEVAPLVWELTSYGVKVCLTQPREDLAMYNCKEKIKYNLILERIKGGITTKAFTYKSLLDSAFHPNTLINIKLGS